MNVAVEELTNILLNSADSSDYLFVSVGEKAFLMMQQSRVVTLRLSPLGQKGHSTFFAPVIHSFPAASGPVAAEHVHLR